MSIQHPLGVEATWFLSIKRSATPNGTGNIFYACLRNVVIVTCAVACAKLAEKLESATKLRDSAATELESIQSRLAEGQEESRDTHAAFTRLEAQVKKRYEVLWMCTWYVDVYQPWTVVPNSRNS